MAIPISASHLLRRSADNCWLMFMQFYIASIKIDRVTTDYSDSNVRL